MAERISIKVEPSGTHENILTVEDAMRQVLDAFALLVGSENEVVWGLVEASTNTPFTAVGEAVPISGDVNMEVVARAQKRRFAESLVRLERGEVPQEWRSGPAHRAALNFFRRNTNGIGRTTVIFDDEPVVVTETAAAEAVRALNQVPPFELTLLSKDRSRTEVGSFEGRLIGVETYYNRPALKLRDRKTGEEVWCRVPDDVMDEISQSTGLKDVWTNKRVRVRGTIRYDENGRVAMVHAQSVRVVTPRPVEVSELRDPEFTEGLSAVEYLRQQRERDFG